ncbi:MAG: dienelactone hydrolase family protein [Chloroflexi bacterium]|nr:dienelactone hydrolase family protein [Chloroflexota bacterium]
MDRVYVMNLVASFQLGHITRRQFLKRSSAALGSVSLANSLLAACAAVPPNAPAPTLVTPAPPAAQPTAETAAEGEPEVMGEDVTYPDRDGEELTGYLAWPASAADSPLPSVIVIQEWWGVNEHIKDVTRRFAAAGYVALAPDLYHGAVATEPDEARKLVMALDMAEAVAEIGQAIDFLLAQESVRGDKAGIVGFCMGGRLVLASATALDTIAAAIPFYGTALSPEDAATVKAPVQGHYGTADGGIPVSSVEAMQTAMEAAGIANEFYLYEGAPHAFFNDTAASYRPAAAQQAWERTLAWFATYLP